MKRGIFMALIVLASKGTIFTKAFKLLKVLKFAKPMVTFLTMALSAFVYGLWLGPWFSIGFVIMLFIHEMGHVLAMRIKGMPISPPVFIPMLGAIIFAPPFKRSEDEAFVGYGGPLVGGAAAFVLFGVWMMLPQPSETVLLVSYTAAFLNLFNLIPLRPFDGGRVTQIIGEWFRYVGIAALLLVTIYIREPAFLLIWILMLSDMRFQPRLKFYLGVFCQIMMMVFMFIGFSSQPWWVDIIDILIASLFNWVFFPRAAYGISYEEKPVSVPVPRSARYKWFFLYAGLVILLIVLMNVQASYLPDALRGGGESVFEEPQHSAVAQPKLDKLSY